MKKSSYLLGMLALGLLSLSSAGGCSSDDSGGGTGGSSSGAGGGSTAGTAGTGTAGTGTAGTSSGPKMTGTLLPGDKAYTILSDADAPAGPTPAPAAYTTNCAGCHGAVGQGTKGLGTEIRHAPLVYSSYVVRNGRPTPSIMPAFPESSVSGAALTEIQTWLAGQPKPTTAQGLYLDFCANCHGPTGGGGSVPVKASGIATATINQVVRAGAGSDPGQRGLYMPAFGTDVLSEGELSMIAQFLGGT